MENFLDRGYRMRREHREAIKNKEFTDPVSGEQTGLGQHERTFRDLSQDKELENLFFNRHLSEFAKGVAGVDMIKSIVETRVHGESFNEAQDAFLGKALRSFNEKTARAERADEALTVEEIRHVADINPKVALILQKVGPEKAAEFLKRDLRDLAISQPGEFYKITNALRALRETRGGKKAEGIAQQIDNALQNSKVDEDAFAKAMQEESPSKRREKLAALVREQIGFFEHAGDWLNRTLRGAKGIQIERVNALYKGYEEQQRLLAACDGHSRSIGDVLLATIRPETKTAIDNYAFGDDERAELPVPSMPGIAEYRNAREENTDRAIATRYNAYRSKEEEKLRRGKPKNYQIPANEQRKIGDRFVRQERLYQEEGSKRYPQDSGLIAWIISRIFGRSEEDIRHIIAQPA